MKGFGSYKVLLKPKHFEGMNVSMTERGLEFDYEIDDSDREEELCDLDDSERKKGKPTRVTVNPVDLSLPDLKSYFSAAQKRYAPEEIISTTYTLSDDYDLAWKSEDLDDEEESAVLEGQTFVMVAWKGKEPSGFVVFELYLAQDFMQKKVEVSCTINLVYVHPNYRNSGYGTDLAVGCGSFLGDVLCAVYKAVSDGYELSPAVFADYVSEGGEHFVERVCGCLQAEVEYLQDPGKSRSIRVMDVELAAFY